MQAREVEMEVLNSVWNGSFEETPTNEDIVSRLQWRGHLIRSLSGSLMLTKAGELRVFHVQCRLALATLCAEQSLSATDEVKTWLISSGFIALAQGSTNAVPTRRGTEWLASL